MDRRKSPSRAAFTLVELLVVILIVGILIGLLLPAVQAAIRKAREAQVTAELNNLATALASFKNLYGDYPPSRVILCEAGYANFQANNATTLGSAVGPFPPGDTNDSDLTYSQLIARSQIYLSKFWPRVDFINGTTLFDFNNNGTTSDVLILSGSECLTFFLGGIPVNNGNGTWAVSGFSKSPLNPFQNNLVQTNRVVPQYEFVVGRLVDQDGDNIPSYIDPLNTVAGNRRSYAYFFSYGSNAYDPNDVNGFGRISDGSNTVADAADFEVDDDTAGSFSERGFIVGFATTSSASNYAVSPAPNPYTTGAPALGNVAWVNPTTFQLFSCGQDGYFGLGGTYGGSSSGAAVLPIYPVTAVPPSTLYDPGNINGISNRIRENDNITSFSGGRLN